MENKEKVKKIKKNPWKNKKKLTKTNGKQRKHEENEGKLIENRRKNQPTRKKKVKNPGPLYFVPGVKQLILMTGNAMDIYGNICEVPWKMLKYHEISTCVENIGFL